MISVIADDTHNPPAWPYYLCGGLFVAGMLIYLIGSARTRSSHESTPNAPEQASTSEGEGKTSTANKPEATQGQTETHSNAKYFLAFIGVVLTALGLWAIIALKGRPQALLAALTPIGLILLAMSIFRFRRRASMVALIFGAISVIILQYTVWTVNYQGSNAAVMNCASGGSAHRSIPIKWIPYRTDSESRFTTSNGIHTLYYPELRWAGYYVPLPSRLCDYTVSFFAKEVGSAHQPVIGDGWGYGLGVCDIAQASAPLGFSFQYEFGQESAQKKVSGFGIVYMPRANTIPSGVNPSNPPYPLDYKWHQWTLKVANDQVTIYFDDDYKVAQEHLTGSGLPDNCSSSGVFFRVWDGTAQFHDFYVTPDS